MKKLVLATLLAGLSTLAVANTSSTYVQGDVMASNLSVRAGGFDKVNDTVTGVRVAVGKDAGDMRYAADYTYFGKADDVKDGVKTKVTSNSVGFSAIHDFDTQTNLVPYVGARIGVNYVKSEVSNAVRKVSEDEIKLAAGATVGVQYNVSPAIALDAGVEYNYLGKGVTHDQYGAKVGVRYNF